MANRTLREFNTPGITSTSSITRPAVDANNFELKPSFISFIKEDQFSGAPMENPNDHITSFLEKCDTVKINGATDEAIRLRLFPFSLRDKAKAWLTSHDANHFTTWNALATAFCTKYFPPGKTAKLHNSITSFAQHGSESLYEAWERFKDLQRQCPHHEIPPWLLIQTFYNGLSNEVKDFY